MEPIENLIKRHEKYEVAPQLISDLYELYASAAEYHTILMAEVAIAKSIAQLLSSKLDHKERDLLKNELTCLVHGALSFGCYGPHYCHDKYLSDSLVEKIKKQGYTIDEFTSAINTKWSTLAEIQPKQDPGGRISHDGPIFRLFVPNEPYKKVV